MTNTESVDTLREKVKYGHERLDVSRWHNFHYERNFWSYMNMDDLDSLKWANNRMEAEWKKAVQFFAFAKAA